MDGDTTPDGTTPVPWRTDAPPRRRWPAVLLVLVLAGGAAGGGFLAWENFEAGSGWQRRAQGQQTRAEVAEARVAELDEALGRTSAQLRRSEADVVLLESRLADLASEKAGAEDSAALAAETAEDLTDVILFATEVGEDLRRCVRANVELLNDMIDAYGGDEVDPEPFNQRIQTANQVCAAAEGAYADLQSRLDALGS